MRLPSFAAVNPQAAVAAALLTASLTLAPPAALADLDYQGSKVGQDKQIASGIGGGAEKKEEEDVVLGQGPAGEVRITNHGAARVFHTTLHALNRHPPRFHRAL